MSQPAQRKSSSGSMHCRRLLSLDDDIKILRNGDVFRLDEAGEDSPENDDGTRTIRFTATSSRPIVRRDMFGEYMEVMPMEKDNDADLEWAQSGNAPLLWQHNRDDHIGNIVAARVVPHGEYRAIEVDVKFYLNDESSQEAFSQVEMGMKRNVSVGFSVRESDYHWEEYDTGKVYQEGKNKGKPVMGDLLVFDKFKLDEVSFVTLPADQSVGIGRSADPAGQFIDYETEVRQMPNDIVDQIEREPGGGKTDTSTAGDGSGGRTSDEGGGKFIRTDEEQRFDVSGQRWLGRNTSMLKERGVDEDTIKKLEAAVDTDLGLSESDIKARAFDAIADVDSERQGKVETRAPSIIGQASNIFSTQRALESYKGWVHKGKEIDGLEGEVITEYERNNAHWAPKRSDSGVFIPHAAIMADPLSRKIMLQDLPAEKRSIIQRAYDVGTVSASNTFNNWHTEVFDDNWFTEALYAKSKVLQMVTKIPTELAQNLIGVTESGSLSLVHEDENDTTAETTGLTFGTRKIEWHQIRGRQRFSQRSLDQSDKIFNVVLDRLRRYLYIGQERALFNGSNASNQPTGTLQLSSIPTISIATNGGNPTHAHMVDMVTRIRTNNAPDTGLMFVMTPEVLGQLEQTAKFTGSQGTASDAIVTDFMGMGKKVNGIPVITSNLLPKNLTKGSTTGSAHAIILCDWSAWRMAMFSAVEMMIDPYSEATTSRTNVYLRQAYDLVIDHVENASVIVDATV